MNVMRTRITGAASVLAVVLLSACALGPRYIKPDVTVPAEYKEHGATTSPARAGGTCSPIRS
jgi:hypothetical protein